MWWGGWGGVGGEEGGEGAGRQCLERCLCQDVNDGDRVNIAVDDQRYIGTGNGGVDWPQASRHLAGYHERLQVDDRDFAAITLGDHGASTTRGYRHGHGFRAVR